MAIVNCPECSKKLKVADTSLGKKVKCSCGTVFVAENGEAPPAAPSVAEKVLVACTECASQLKVAATSLGKKMKCPKCAGIFVAALPATAKADEDEPSDSAAVMAQDEEEDLPKPKAKPRKMQEEEDEEDDAPQPAAKPVYPSRLWVNLFVLFLVLAYGAFFAVTHPDIKLLDLKLIKDRPIQQFQIRGGAQPDGPGQADGKKNIPLPPIKGKMGKSKKDDIKKDEPTVEKQSSLGERLRDPGADTFLTPRALNPMAQGRERSERTLGNGRGRSKYAEGVPSPV